MAAAKKKRAPAKRAPGVKKKKASPAKSKRRVTAKKAGSSAVRAQADAIAEEAKKAGATKGGRLPSAKQQLRDSMIVARVAQGLTYPVIAQEAHVNVRTIERVVAAARERSPLEDAPMKLLEDLAIGIKLAIGDFEAMALAWMDTNQSAALGAKKAATEARGQLATLMADVGKLPSNLAAFRSEMQMQRFIEEMSAKMRAVASGEADLAEAIEYFQQLVEQAQRGELSAAA